jgi:hypothetical protein
VAAQEVLHGLIEEKLQIQGARMVGGPRKTAHRLVVVASRGVSTISFLIFSMSGFAWLSSAAIVLTCRSVQFALVKTTLSAPAKWRRYSFITVSILARLRLSYIAYMMPTPRRSRPEWTRRLTYWFSITPPKPSRQSNASGHRRKRLRLF